MRRTPRLRVERIIGRPHEACLTIDHVQFTLTEGDLLDLAAQLLRVMPTNVVPEKSDLLTLQQAAKRYGPPYTSLRDLVLSGHLPKVQLGNSRRIWVRRDDLERLIKASTSPSVLEEAFAADEARRTGTRTKP